MIENRLDACSPAFLEDYAEFMGCSIPQPEPEQKKLWLRVTEIYSEATENH
jgi:hypothetical protein